VFPNPLVQVRLCPKGWTHLADNDSGSFEEERITAHTKGRSDRLKR